VYGSGMVYNPSPFLVFAFLIVGLVWSGGHVGWIIALGIWTLIVVVTTASKFTEAEEASKRQRRGF
jgi:hypothetical protein